MELRKYLVITPPTSRYRGVPNVKLINKLGKSSIASNAVVLKLNLDLPDALFQKPQLEATIKVAPDQVSKPVIEPEVLQNIQEVMKKQLGVDITLTVVEEKKKK